MFSYFVSYSFWDVTISNDVGFGNAEMRSSRRIETFADIQQMTSQIEEGFHLKKVVILSFQLLSGPQEEDV